MPRGAARAIGYDVGVSASRDEVQLVAFAERKHDFESEHNPRSVFLTLTSRHRVTGSMLSVALPRGTTCELLECALEGYGATDDSATPTAHGVFSLRTSSPEAGPTASRGCARRVALRAQGERLDPHHLVPRPPRG